MITAVVLSVLAAAVAGMYFLSVKVYNKSFDYRCTTGADVWLDISQFPGLARERHTFRSHQGQQLVGYLYTRDGTRDKKALVVFAHGLGAGGQTAYMDIFDFLAARGYAVFAYDATGNDESEGERVGGLPQGYIDLKYAMEYAASLPETSALPVVLMGYSWGGLSVANVLNYHPEVKAVAALAGWNRSMDLIDHRGCQTVGKAAKLMLPFAAVYEHVRYGDYASSTALKGFAKSDCRVLIVHGQLDTSVPIRYGYDTYYAVYGQDSRFTFLHYPDRAHGILDVTKGVRDMELVGKIADFFDSSLTS